MQLAVWTYEGPPHVGAMRIATAMKKVHFILHAPQGDTYADLLFTMIERRNARPPVTYTTFEARDLGSDTAEIYKRAVIDAVERFSPDAIIVGASCTAELIQDDPGGLARAAGIGIPVIPVELPSYTRKEHWGASETFYQVVRHLADKASIADRPGPDGRSSCNILGPSALGFRHRDDVVELTRLLRDIGVDINVVAPLGAGVDDIRRLGAATFNVVLYPELGETTARWLEREYGQPFVATPPIGVAGTRQFVEDIAKLLDRPLAAAAASNLPWWSRSIDSNYLTGKRVFVFGEGAKAAAIASVAADELAFDVVGVGCYNREMARQVRTAAQKHGVEPLITDDYLEVEAAIAELQPELILGTQMERHIGKRLGIPCAVISAPAHVQDYPARYSPHVGPEGANVLFDAFIHPLVMGLEEHLLAMFREDFEFNDEAGPSHVSHGRVSVAQGQETAAQSMPAEISLTEPETHATAPGETWSVDAEKELRKIPFFVRGKARRNAEQFAADHGHSTITVDVLYEAKAHYAR
ncbi:MAG: ferredoxin:protochlorophyllide reductase (ATP-dependent) subunit B [Alphaproteobacteria bacterium]|nr:ferredoxin:protochlorophyllide reductase (ATP-dependent) subunit B [Alphaproteobacteria bacterium]